MKRITDPDFKYTPSHATNLRKTFARVRREQELQRIEQERVEQERGAKVSQLKRAK
jgi:hypothetical protein